MRVSFVHPDPKLASCRLRAKLPSEQLGWGLNDLSADVLILSKPSESDIELMMGTKTVVADFCDPHFARVKHYREILALADFVTCSSQIMGQIIASQGRMATVIPDCYEHEQAEPHFSGAKLFWNGHPSNLYSLKRVLPELRGYDLRVMSDIDGCLPFSEEGLKQELAAADIFIIPATEGYKNPNRAVTAIRNGCFVVAEPHPAFVGFPCYVGNIKEGIEWATKNPAQAVELIRRGQEFISQRYSPKTVASAWKKAIQLACTSVAGNTDGKAGLTAISRTPTLTPTYESSHSMTATQT